MNLQEIQETIDECPVTLYWVYVEHPDEEPTQMPSHRLPETVEKKECYETSVYQEKKRDLYSTSVPDIEEQEVNAKDLPPWATFNCTPVITEDAIVFVKSERGPLRVPKAYDEAFLTLILDKDCVITTFFEWSHE